MKFYRRKNKVCKFVITNNDLVQAYLRSNIAVIQNKL